MEKIGKFDIKGKGYLWKFLGEGIKLKKIEGWNADYEPWLIDAAGYVIRAINKRDGVPIVEDSFSYLSPEQKAEVNCFAEALRQSQLFKRKDV